ncbi:unnamed protein product [Clonostachys byssicola]|uniref:Transglycosylase SLT domain-containing protein n=1 Tax=Clonostachys byssicola TaxID=160290 RepID=A0A9N9USA6_9HYPO|nr:unnamed protein product [Clonostachys byssicola]
MLVNPVNTAALVAVFATVIDAAVYIGETEIAAPPEAALRTLWAEEIDDARPPPPEAALRPLWVEGDVPTRPASVVILPTDIENDPNLELRDDDVDALAAIADKYTFWQGNGANWPKKAAWGSFSQLWNANLPIIRKSCGWNNWGADNSATEISNLQKAINQVAGEAKIEPRFILSIVMQESGGCVRVPTTNNGVRNPGLMQSHNGAGTCAGKNPCPNAQILQMIRDGTSGTKAGDGIKQCLAKTSKVVTNAPHRAVFAAARLYNSGSVDYNNLNNPFTATKCYSCDVANRLTGWTLAARKCS